MDEMSRMYIELLCEALRMFYKNDAEALFKNQAADERAMVGCIYRYAWCLMHAPRYENLLPDIDIEYDRMSSPHAKKAFDLSKDHNKIDCNQYDVCGKVIYEYKQCYDGNHELCKTCVEHSRKWRDFRPDLIIHKRGSSIENGLVAEFKKKGDNREGANSKGIDFDKAKVMFCTCQNAEFKYKVGAVVILHKDRCDMTIYQNGKEKMMPCCVCAKSTLKYGF